MKKIFSLLLLLAMLTAYIPASAATTQERLTQAEEYVTQLAELIQKCEAKGLDVGYEKADYEIIKDFIEYGRQDIEWGHTQRAGYVADCLDTLYEADKQKLESYLTGVDKPLETVKNNAADYAGGDGGNFVDKNGKPVIFNGYGVFEMLKNDIDRLQDFGADVAQIEIGPKAVLSEIGAINGWSVSLYGGADASAQVIARDGGGSCLKIVNETSSSDGYLALRQNVSVSPNTTYVLSMEIKTVEAGTAFFSPQGWGDYRCRLKAGTSDWAKYSVEYTTSSDEYSAEALFVSNSPAQAIYIDNVEMYEKDTDENIIQNGGFESSEGLTSEHFQANSAPIRDSVTRVLDTAYENGVMVNVLISPHYFPAWILQKYPEAATPDCGLGYDIYNPIAQEAIELYIKALMQEIGAHPALHSICISNEPTCDTRNTQGLDEKYSEYLGGIYGSIAELNKVYSASYSSFDEVKMPTSDTMDAKYYDWVQFNNAYAAGWNKFLADTVKKYAPDVAVHAKIMTIFGKADSLNYGINPEDFAEFTDYSGNDAWGFYGATASGLISKLMWYDLLNSIKPDAPIINSEDHIIEDGNENYSANQAIHVGADIWQGAVHGRDASIIWIWNRTSDKSAATYGNILYRPDVLSQVSRKSLDINRLADKIAALQSSESGVSILYSPTTRAYNTAAVGVMKLAYEAGLYAGAKPQFITERQLENGVMLKGALVIPMVTNISDGAWQAIKGFKQSGGTIIALGENCLERDEHNILRAESLTFDSVVSVAFSGNSVTSPLVDEITDIIADKTGVEMLNDINGNTQRDVEKISAECGGKTIWNLCNYSWNTAPKVALPAVAENLITGEVYTDYIELSPFTPVLLEFCEPEFSIDAKVSGSNNSRRIGIDIYNTGKTAGLIEISVFLKNSETDVIWERMDISKYVSENSVASCGYEFILPQGSHSALINARYGNGEKTEQITVDLY